jgi:uncharacterized protein (TIGR02246 family)
MSEDEKAIRQLVETWMTASKAGDTETVLGLMADDAVFMVPAKSLSAKKPFARRRKARKASASTAKTIFASSRCWVIGPIYAITST